MLLVQRLLRVNCHILIHFQPVNAPICSTWKMPETSETARCDTRLLCSSDVAWVETWCWPFDVRMLLSMYWSEIKRFYGNHLCMLSELAVQSFINTWNKVSTNSSYAYGENGAKTHARDWETQTSRTHSTYPSVQLMARYGECDFSRSSSDLFLLG